MKTPARKFSDPAIAVLLFVATVLGAGCAKIADPQPPEVRIPKPAGDLAVRQISDYVALTFSKPEQNMTGTEVTTLKRVDLYRLGSETPGLEPTIPDDQFIDRAVRIQSIPPDRFPEYLKDKVFVFQDRFAPLKSEMYAHTFWYAVLFVNNKNQSAGLSNRVSIAPVPIPPPPADITVEETQNSIRLKWAAPSENMDGSRPPRNAGYNVYRTETPNRFPSSPINPDPVKATEFEDTNFGFGTTYYYAITTVGSLQQPPRESLLSDALTVATKDVFPPAPPSDFTAIIQGNTAILFWAPSPSADVEGYRIFRKEKGSADQRIVQSELIRALSFRDTPVDPAKQYEYEIQAVDVYGNAGPAVSVESEQR